MVAPSGVNEGTPQDPTAAGLTQAEAVTEDPAGPAADLGEPAGDPNGTAPAKAEPTRSATTGPVPAEIVPSQPGPIEAGPIEAGPIEAGPIEAGPIEAAHTEAEPAESKRAEAGNAEAGPTETGPTEAELTAAELTTAELTTAELAEKGLAEKGLAGDAERGLAERQENRAGDAQEAGEAGEAPRDGDAQEASRDVGPLAVVGIIVGVIALVGVAAGVLAMVTHGFKPKTVVTYRPAAVFGLRPGQCVDAGSNSLSFTLVSCARPHDAEVFARFSLPAAAWPGSSAVRHEAGDGCASRLSGYLNPQLASIGLTQEYVYPDHGAWEANQRTVVCEVSSGNGRLTGSVRANT